MSTHDQHSCHHKVTIQTTDDQVLTVPAEITGLDLIDRLGHQNLTLGVASRLKNGDVLRGFMPVGPDERRFDLGTFDDIFLGERRWFASILSVERSWGVSATAGERGHGEGNWRAMGIEGSEGVFYGSLYSGN